MKFSTQCISFLKENISLWAAILASGLLFAIRLKIPINEYDEGIVLLNAARIMNGEVPYRDFWSPYPPGQFYSVAMIFNVFGKSILVARLYDLAVRVALVGIVFAFSKNLMSRSYSIFVCGGAIALLSYSGFYLYPIFPSLMWTLLGVFVAFKTSDTSSHSKKVWPGIILGCAACFRLEIAFPGVVAVLIHILSSQFKEDIPRKYVVGNMFKQSLWLFIGLLLIMIPVYLFFVMKCGWYALWLNLVQIPFNLSSSFRSTKPPPFIPQLNDVTLKEIYTGLRTWFFFYFPIFVYCFAFWRIVHSIVARTKIQLFSELAALTWLGILFLPQMISRFDPIHALAPTLISFILFPLLMLTKDGSRIHVRKRIAYVLALGIIVFYFVSATRLLFQFSEDYPPRGRFSNLEHSGGVSVAIDQEQAVNFIQKHTLRRETIFVGNRRNDLAFMNDISFYFLADRPPSTYYSEFDPGITTTFNAQKQMVNELGSVRWIVLVDMPLSTESNISSVSSKVTYLDDFIQRNFTLVQEIGRYQIYYFKSPV